MEATIRDRHLKGRLSLSDADNNSLLFNISPVSVTEADCLCKGHVIKATIVSETPLSNCLMMLPFWKDLLHKSVTGLSGVVCGFIHVLTVATMCVCLRSLLQLYAYN